VGSSSVGVKPKDIKCAFAASPLRTHAVLISKRKDWLAWNQDNDQELV
jgi:hypothetical protein